MRRVLRDPACETVVLPVLSLLAVLAALGAGAVSTGSEPVVVCRWFAVVLVGVLLPGLCIVRLVRSTTAALAVDLAWAVPAGFLVTMGVWLVGHAVGRAVPSVGAGMLVLAVALLVPGWRIRILARPAADGWRARHVLAVTGAGFLLVRLLTTTGLHTYRPRPTLDSPTYHADLLFQVALTSELRRTVRPQYPMVAGEPLSYHWFVHAIAAQLGGGGQDDFDIVIRLLPGTLMVLLVMVAAAVGAQIARTGAGASAAALVVAASSPVAATLWSTGAEPAVGNGGAVNPLLDYWQLSPTQTLGWVLGLASFGLVVAWVRRHPADEGVPVRLLVPVLVVAGGAKASQNFVLLGGIALLGLVLVVARLRGRRSVGLLLRRTFAVGALLSGVTVVLGLALYPHSYGLVWHPGEQPALLAARVAPGAVLSLGNGPGSVHVAMGLGLGSILLVVLPMLMPWSGAMLLLVRDRLSIAGWMAIGAALFSLAAGWCLRHPGGSEWYFVLGAAPIALTASAGGLAAELQRLWSAHRRPRDVPITVLCLSAGFVAPALVALASAYGAGLESPLQGWRRTMGHAPAPGDLAPQLQLARWLSPLLLVVSSIFILGSVAAWLLIRWGPLPTRGVVASVFLLSALGAGMPATLAHAFPDVVEVLPAVPVDPPREERQRLADTARVARWSALLEAGRIVRREAAATDIVATNRVPRADGPAAAVSDNGDFAVCAVTGLRTDVSGYAYAGRNMAAWTSTFMSYRRLPFWDQARLRRELMLVEEPSSQRLAEAYRRGTRWIVADERAGPVSPLLGFISDEQFVGHGIHVYRLRAPLGQLGGATASPGASR